MTTQVTRKSIVSNYKCFSFGYCELHPLFANSEREYYTAGVYGWNANVFISNGIAIISGYRPFGKDVKREVYKPFVERAEALTNDFNTSKGAITFEQYRKSLSTLQSEFAEALKAL